MGAQPTTDQTGVEKGLPDVEVRSLGEAKSLVHVPVESKAMTKKWTIEDSEALYRIQGWGEPYFSINAAGHVTVSPKGERGGSLDLFELVNALK
jgi:arginine decarboxylase